MSAAASGVLIAGRSVARPAFHDASSCAVVTVGCESAVGWRILANGSFTFLPVGVFLYCCHAASASEPRATTASIMEVLRIASNQRLRYAATFASLLNLFAFPCGARL